MKGFFKRDIYLMLPNLRFYLIFIVVIAAVALFNSEMNSFLSFYVALFSSSSILGLFSYDEFNHWNGYAAAVPGGRGRMVDARYLVALTTTALIFVTMALLNMFSPGGFLGGLGLSALYSGMTLVYLAFALPISYRFGSHKSRIILIAFIAGGAGCLGAIVSLSTRGGGTVGGMAFSTLGFVLFAIGLAFLAVSWLISRRIMGRKEF